MPLSAGDKLGPYEILAHIGAGGMGEVYKARDTRLDRVVAIKVSKTEFSERFEHEAVAIAALNHPNICQLYDVGPNYLVMEFIEGTALKGPMTSEKGVEYGGQILDALDAAHRKGFTHRDLKPANILVTKHGIKLLDFGLAKRNSGICKTDVTLTAAITQQGQITGTLQYMSPEQLQGKEADSRSDIFSFGCVLYEMLSGQCAFAGSSAASVIAAILEREPEPLKSTSPLDRVIRKCLAKDPDNRFQNARDLKYNLGLAIEAAAASPSKIPMSWAIVSVLALFALATSAAATVIWIRWHPTKLVEDRPLTRLSVDLGPDADDTPRQSLAISPDGTRIAFRSHTANGSYQLSLLSLSEAKANLIPGTENGSTPFFSPDGKWLGFVSSGKLMKILLQGGDPIFLAEMYSGVNGASWGPNGSIVGTMGNRAELGTQTGLSLVPDSGGTPQPLTRPSGGEATHRWPQFLPGGESVLFTAHTLLDDFDDACLEVVSVKTGKIKTVLRGGYFGRYVPSGHLIYLRDGVLYGVRFDLGRLETQGPAKPLLDDVAVSTAWGTGRFDFSQTGVFVYRRPAATNWPIVWLDSSGKTERLLDTPRPYYTPRLSPDGKKLAVSDGGITRGNILVYDLQRDKMTSLTFDGQGHFSPVWASDGKHVIYRSHYAAAGEYTLEWARADGSGEPLRLLTSKTAVLPYSISNDGRHLAYLTSKNGYDIWTLPIDVGDSDHPKPGNPEPFLTTSSNELEPVFSPDGRWVAYVSNESRRARFVYVRPATDARDVPDRKWTISEANADFPMWSRNSHELFYLMDDQLAGTNYGYGRIMVMSYSTPGDSFVAERPRVWSPQPVFMTEQFSNLDLSPDSKRFAAFPNPDERDKRDAATRLSVLQNFFDEVSRRVPEGAE
jgi:serine/threonine protein kinase